MAYRDFREWMDHLEREGELKRINVPFECRRGASELYPLRYYVGQTDGPALYLENLQGLNTPGIPVVLLPFGSQSGKRIAIAMEAKDWQTALDKHMKVLNDRDSWLDPVMVKPSQAPCKEVIIKEANIDIRKHIPKVWFGEERQAYITWGISITKDCDSHIRNVTHVRYGMLDVDLDGKPFPEDIQRRCLSSHIYAKPPHSHIGMHYAKQNRRGKPLEVAICVLCDPAVHIAAATSPPYDTDELRLAGGLRGAPVELVKCETIDMEVPATAEWVIEGEAIPEQEIMDGPHYHNLGYIGLTKVPITRVKCITHRKNPIWAEHCSDLHSMDALLLTEFTNISHITSEMRAKIPQVKAVAVHPRPHNFGFVVVQLSVDGPERPLGIAQQVMASVWGLSNRYGRMQKYVIVVGPDIDPWNLWDVVWALCTRVQPQSDSTFTKGAAKENDPSAMGAGDLPSVLSEQMGIDATIKVPEKWSKFQPVLTPPSPAEIEKIKGKLGDLVVPRRELGSYVVRP